IAIFASRDSIGGRIREFTVAVLVMEGLMIGALLARDLVLFYVCYEAMLIPMVVLIALFGGAGRRGAALQFFLYTMFGSVFTLVALAQTDVKRLMAYSSLSHLGLVMVGIFTFNATALSGVAVQMVAHGLSVAALFLLIGQLESRSPVKDRTARGIDDYGGLVGR